MLRPDSAVASIPCGLMSEVLLATSEPFSDVHLYAIDNDSKNFDLIQEKYGERLVGNDFHKVPKNALDIDYEKEHKERFDVICSIGFTIYLPNDDDVQKLFNGFYIALKKNGMLVTNFAAEQKKYTNVEDLKIQNPTYRLVSGFLILHDKCYNTLFFEYCDLIQYLFCVVL